METSSVAYGVGTPRQLLSFKYDYLGRRVRKTVANWNGSTYVASVDRKFIYDGWNLLAEYDALTSFTLVRSYLWGLDLTRTLQDGGGVGGLLAVIDATTSTIHQPYHDANGNVHALVNRATGTITAAYEYSAFGETLRATGAFAQGNPFRFSTKYTDDETGLVYYGRRYYDPKSGRFLGRDPIEEKGGLHLYGFVGNNAINRWDYLGMDDDGAVWDPVTMIWIYQAPSWSVPVGSSSSYTYNGNTYINGYGVNGYGGYLNGEGLYSSGSSNSGYNSISSFSGASSSGVTIGGGGSITSGAVTGTYTNSNQTGDAAMRAALSAFFNGTRQANLVFGQNDPWTADMQKHPHVVATINQLTSLLTTNPQDLVGVTTTADFNLNNQSLMTNISTYVRDGFAGIGLTGAQYSMGSFRMSYTVTGVSNGVATVSFQITDALSFGSFTRVPTTGSSFVSLIGAGAIAGGDMNILPIVPSATTLTFANSAANAPASSVNNPMGPNAPFNTVNLQWNWTQPITIPPPSTDKSPVP